MKHTSPSAIAAPVPLPPPVTKALYVGTLGDEIASILAPHSARFDVTYKSKVVEAMQAVRKEGYDLVFVDQRSDQLAVRLFAPLVLVHAKKSKLVILCDAKEMPMHLATPGVARVLPAPVRPGQILRLFGVEEPVQQAPERKPAKPHNEAQKIRRMLFGGIAVLACLAAIAFMI